MNDKKYDLPFISICIAVKNEEKHIARTLDNLWAQDYPKEKMEVLLMDGNSTDKTVEIASTYKRKFGDFKIINNPGTLSACGWNLGVKEAKHEIIAFLTGHITMQEDYYSRLIQHLTPGIAGVGGNINPAGTNKRSNQISRAFKSKLGTGGAHYLSGKETKFVDTITVACYWKEDIVKVNGHDEKLVRGQDWDMNMRIVNGGRKLLFVHDLYANFYVRDRFSSLWKRQYYAGLWKPYIGKKPAGNFMLRHFVPALFALTFTALLLLSLFSKTMLLLFSILLGVYFLIILLDNVKNKIPLIDFPIMYFIYFIIHYAYGLGFILGIGKHEK